MHVRSSHCSIGLFLAFFECGLFHATTTLHLLLLHYYRRSTTCLFCGRSYLPKGHSKGPDVVGGAKAIRSVLFSLSTASLDPLTAVRCRFAIHAGTRHTTVARTRPRTSAPPCCCISGVLKDPFRKDTLSNFVISLFTYQLHAIFLGLFLSKTLQQQGPPRQAGPATKPPHKPHSESLDRRTLAGPALSPSRYGSQGRWDQMGMPIVPKGSPCQRLHPYR